MIKGNILAREIYYRRPIGNILQLVNLYSIFKENVDYNEKQMCKVRGKLLKPISIPQILKMGDNQMADDQEIKGC